MAVIKLTTAIRAPIERVFDLARSIDMHTNSASATAERAVRGVTSGLIGPDQEVTWRARHFGIWQSLTVRIIAFDRPTHFADRMIEGAFQRMEHHHRFEPSPDGTVMRDVFEFESPFGLAGRLVDRLFLKAYMRAFLVERNRVLKVTAESDAWRRYL